jgi:hypothetical protein
MTRSVVVYELAIVGGRLDAARFEQQTEELTYIVTQRAGAAVGAWEWHFPTFNAATEATRGFRRMGLAFDAVQIKAVDGFSGHDLPI